MLRMTDRQHRARGQPDDALSDAPHEHVREPASALRAHHDRVNAFGLRVLNDRFRRHDGGHDDRAGPKLAAIFVREDRVEARVTRDVKVSDRVAIPAGSRVIGAVTVVERGGKFKDAARLCFRFHTLVLAAFVVGGAAWGFRSFTRRLKP